MPTTALITRAAPTANAAQKATSNAIVLSDKFSEFHLRVIR